MGYKNYNGVDILTNIRKKRIDTNNNCHRQIINAKPYEYWYFENIIDDPIDGFFNRSKFKIYDTSLNYSFDIIDGLVSSSAITGIIGNENNAFLADLNRSLLDYPNGFSIQFWYKPFDNENKILSFGNDDSDFGLREPTNININQFSIECEQIFNGNTKNYDFLLKFNIWDSQTINSDNTIPEPLYQDRFVINNIELSVFQQFIITFENSTLNIYYDGELYFEKIITTQVPTNNKPLKLAFGYSTNNNPYGFDEIAFYDYKLDTEQIKNQNEVCKTLPSLGGWFPEISSGYLRFETQTYYNDTVYYKKSSPENIWNNSLGYRNNNSGRYQFDIYYYGEKNNDSIGFGLADKKASNYTKLGSSFPCSENSLAVYREDEEWILYIAINRNYKKISTGQSYDLNNQSVVSIFLNFNTYDIEIYIDKQLIIAHSFSNYIENISLHPATSLFNDNGWARINTIGNFVINDDNYLPWGVIQKIPDYSSDVNENTEWDKTYQERILYDEPSYYWRFQENRGTKAIDEINDVKLNHESGVNIARSGLEGFGVYYDNNSSTYLNEFPPVYKWDNGSIEFWIHYDGSNDDSHIIMEFKSNDDQWFIRVIKDYQDDNLIFIKIFENNQNGENVNDLILPIEEFEFDAWNHIVIKISELRLFQCYVNGELSLEICGVNWANRFLDHTLTINTSSGNNSSFYFDELVFYDKFIDAELIKEHYLIGKDNIEDVEDLNLVFRGIPNHITSTIEFAISSLTENEVKYWGWYAQTSQWKEYEPIQTQNVSQIASSKYHFLVIDNNSVKGRGQNNLSQASQPSVLSKPVIMISTGDFHSLALLSDRTLYAWGDNSWGQTIIPQNLGNIVQIDSGSGHNIVLLSNGSIKCWGKNNHGECNVPEDFKDIIQVCAGNDFSAALRTNGKVEIWGAENNTSNIKQVKDIDNVVQISSMGCSYHIVALTSDGIVHCFGNNDYSQCDMSSDIPFIQTISNGTYSTFAQDKEGNIYCAGVIIGDNNETRPICPFLTSTYNVIELDGPEIIKSNNTYEYKITNYDPEKSYNVTSDTGSVSIEGDTITLQTPEDNRSERTATITVNNDVAYTDHTSRYVYDEILIDGPEVIETSNTYKLYIINYDPFKDYNVSSDLGDVSIDGKKITLETPESNAFNEVLTVSITDSTVTTDYVMDFLFDVILLDGPSSVKSNKNYEYIIENYKSSKNYNVSSNLGTVSISDDIVTLKTPNSNNTEKTITISIDDGNIFSDYDIRYLYDDIKLDGPEQVESNNTYQYTITNYDSSKNYNVSTDIGTISITNDTVTLETPDNNNSNKIITISIDDGEVFTDVNITYPYDDILLDGPEQVESNNSYQYTITNYDSSKNYNVSTDIGTISITNDIVTLETPNSNDTEKTIIISINDEHVSSSKDVTYLYDDILLDGPEQVESNNTYQYTITNYDSSKNYNVSTDIGTVSITNDTVILETPESNDMNKTIIISINDEHVSSSKDVTYLYDDILLDGPEQVESNNTYQYTITNYDSSKNYNVSTDIGNVTIDGDIVTLETPDINNITYDSITISIDDGTVSSNISVDYLYDSIALDGPEQVESNNTYQYTITNYDSSKNYNVSTDIGTVSISDNTVTLETPESNDTEKTITISINNEQLSGSKNVTYLYDSIALDGPEQVESNNTYQYTITNYDSSKSYSVSTDIGTVSISDDTVTLETPDSNNSNKIITININDGQVSSNKDVTYLYDDILLDGPEQVESNNTYQYTITNYDSSKNYNVSTDIGTVSISDNTVTLETPESNDTEKTIIISINDEHVSSSKDVTYLYDDILLDGPDPIQIGDSYQYTITNFDSSKSYSASTDIGTVTIDGDILTLDLSNVDSAGTANVTITDETVSSDYTYTVTKKPNYNGNIYVDYSGAIYKLDENLEPIWHNSIPNSAFIKDFDIDYKGKVHILTDNNHLIILNSFGTIISNNDFSDIVQNFERTIACSRDGNYNYMIGEDKNNDNLYHLYKVDNSGNVANSVLTPHTDRNLYVDEGENIYQLNNEYVFIKFDKNLFRIYDSTVERHVTVDGVEENSYPEYLETDKKGNIYIFSRHHITKFNPDGEIIWTAYTENVGNTEISYYSGTIDNDQNIYIGDYNDIHKIDSNGQQIWKKQITNESIRHLTSDDFNNLYFQDFDDYLYIKKYNSNGEELISFKLNDNDAPNNIKTDYFYEENNIILNGPEILEPDNIYEFTISNYDSSKNYNVSTDIGNVSINNDTISVDLTGLNSSAIINLTVDDGDKVNRFYLNMINYILDYGNILDNVYVFTDNYESIVRLNSNGELLWHYKPHYSSDNITADNEGNVYIFDHSSTNNNNIEIIDKNHQFVTLKQYYKVSEFGTNMNSINVTMVDNNNNFYINHEYTNSSNDTINQIVKLDSNLDKVWEITHDNNSDNSQFIDFKLSPDGSYYILERGGFPEGGGTQYEDIIRKFDSNLNEVWSYQKSNHTINGFDVDSVGNVYATFDNFTTTNNIVLQKISIDGSTILWSENFEDIYDKAPYIKIDSQDNYYLLVEKDQWGTPNAPYIMRYDSNDNRLWSNSEIPSYHDYDIDSQDNLIISNALEEKIYKISTNGNVIWKSTVLNDVISFSPIIVVNSYIDLDGPEQVESNNTYQYTITNYDSSKNYNVSTDIGTVSISDDIVTLETPESNDTEKTITISINNEQISGSKNVTYLYDDILLDGPDPIQIGDTYQYTITNFDSSKSYSASTDIGTVTVDGNILTLDLSNVDSAETANVTITDGTVSSDYIYTVEEIDGGSGEGSSGNIYVAGLDNTVRKIDSSGNEVWSFTGHNTGHSNDQDGAVYSVAVDQHGNVYSGGLDNTVRKIDSSGNEVWVKNDRDLGRVHAVAVDLNGWVYCSDSTRVYKIDSSGRELWSLSINVAYDVAVDQNGNVYTAEYDNIVRKIDSRGNEVWKFTGHTDYVNSVAVDASGYIYSGSDDETVRNLDSSGNEIWKFTGHTNHVNGVSVDQNGNVYSCSGSSSNNHDYTLRKLDSSGNEVWKFTGHTDYVVGVAVDQDGNVYSGSTDETVRKLDSSGNELWSFTRFTNTAYDIAVDPGAIGAGFWNDILLEGSNPILAGNIYDYTISNYDSNKTYTATTDLGTVSVNGNTVTLDLTNVSSSATANITITDGSVSCDYSYTVNEPLNYIWNVYSGSSDDTVRKIDSRGNEVWKFTGHTDEVESVAVDQDGNVYSAGEDSTVRKIDSSGNEVWKFTGHSSTVFGVISVAVDQDGNVYSGSADDTVRKLDSSGNEVWKFTGHTDDVISVAVDQDGNVYSGSSDNTLRKIDSNGNEVWVNNPEDNPIRSVAVDQDGNVYSTSVEELASKFDSSGNLIWSRSGDAYVHNSIAVDQNGNVYTGSRDEGIRKIDSSGNDVWKFTGYDDAVKSVAVDQDGNVYGGGNHGDQRVLRRIDSSGHEVWSFTTSNRIRGVAVDPGTVGAGFWS
ncbi:hypothetical protein PBI_SCTP2_442 [Salicola phage SCTP-2]|nr:hypothetical protein PBI_SCTP2_442 [Salicola phage SCTP-2]